MSGFNEFVPQELITVFDERELELLVGGIAEIDMDDWKKYTDYRGYTENDEVVQWFWKVGHFAEEVVLVAFSLTKSRHPTVCQILGRGKEVSVAPIRHRHVSYPRQRVQGLAR